jgi:hypothetical protein
MIYKLIYTYHDSAITDLLAKGVLINTFDLNGNEINAYAPTTHAVVYIGEITGITGYHVDVMTDQTITFTNSITPNNPKHNFL